MKVHPPRRFKVHHTPWRFKDPGGSRFITHPGGSNTLEVQGSLPTQLEDTIPVSSAYFQD